MNVLIVQRPDVLAAQRTQISTELAPLKDISLRFASSPEEAAQHPDTDILICPTLPFLDDIIGALPRLQWIHFLSAGVDPIWTMSFDKSRYRLSKSTGVHAATISEFVVGAMLYAVKRLGAFQRQQAQRHWQRFHLEECAGKTLAILGLGTIGARLASLAKAMEMRVIGTVAQARDIAHVDHVYASHETSAVLSQADFVVLLAPLTPTTRGMMDDAAFAAMKESAWLINVARGELVQEDSLVQALQNGTIAGAILDVFEEEPLPPASPLWDMENVLITPHVAGTTQRYMEHALEIFKRNYHSYVTTGELITPVSLEKGY